MQRLPQRRRPPRRARGAASRRRSSTTARSPAPKRTLTYRTLQEETAALGAVLQELGVGKGDRVILYMPMIPEAAIAMLACARIGAIHSVVFGGFAATELATRIEDAAPKVILSASCGVEAARIVPYKPLLDEAIALSRHKPQSLSDLPAAAGRGRDDGRARPRLGRDGRGREGRGPARRLRAGRRDRPALHPLHLRHDRAPEGRRARHRRLSRRAEMVDARPLRGRARRGLSGAPPTSAGSSAIPTSSTGRCCTAAPRSSTRASRSGRRTPAPSGASSPSTAPSRCSPRRPPSAPSRRRTPTAS